MSTSTTIQNVCVCVCAVLSYRSSYCIIVEVNEWFFKFRSSFVSCVITRIKESSSEHDTKPNIVTASSPLPALRWYLSLQSSITGAVLQSPVRAGLCYDMYHCSWGQSICECSFLGYCTSVCCVERERDERRLIAWFWITVAASSAIAWECCINLAQSNSQT